MAYNIPRTLLIIRIEEINHVSNNEKLVCTSIENTYPSLIRFQATLNRTECESPSLLKADESEAYGCATSSSKSSVVSIICSACITLSRYSSNQFCCRKRTIVGSLACHCISKQFSSKYKEH